MRLIVLFSFLAFSDAETLKADNTVDNIVEPSSD